MAGAGPRQYVNAGCAASSERAVLVSASHNLAELSVSGRLRGDDQRQRVVASGPIHELAGRSPPTSRASCSTTAGGGRRSSAESCLGVPGFLGKRTIAFRCPDAQAVRQVVSYSSRSDTSAVPGAGDEGGIIVAGAGVY